jgi:signal transduction histidine kinase
MSTQITTPLVEALRTVEVFADITEEQMEWLAAHVEELRFNAGDLVSKAGEPADYMLLTLEGAFEARRADATVFSVRAGAVTGLLPGSRLTHFPNNVYATEPLRVARLHKSLFWQMIEKMPQMGPRLIGVLTDRVRTFTRQEEQREKLVSLGKLSAGLAHELNNPASAVRQSAASIREAVKALQKASIRLSKQPLALEQKARFFDMEREGLERMGKETLDPLDQSDREQALTDWMEKQGVEQAWKLAPGLVEAGFSEEKLSDLAVMVPRETVCDAMVHIGAMLALEQLVREIETSAGRISDLVQAIKEYTFMDQAPEQEIDVHQGIDSTLTILGYKLKHGVNVVREYDMKLPRICAHGSELNQVWTNLIDNAIGAMEGKGEIRIRTFRQLQWLVVQVIDNGPGIPQEIQGRIFEPFFTTKDVGEGTGLGLELVQRIVKVHKGEVRFESKPGRTCFEVRLPIPQ